MKNTSIAQPKTHTIRNLALLAGAGIALGAALAALSAPADFGRGLPGAAGLSILLLWALYTAWRWAGGGRALAWIIALAFVLRLGSGALLTTFLPVWGYDEEEQNAGYLYPDAMRRDLQAWNLAQSDQPVASAIGADLVSDQYGGLLAVSALLYRGLSPDAHRPLLVVALGAGVSALGVAFFWSAVQRRWGLAVAGLGAWILALYPESVLLGASQMREPYLITLIAVAFWGSLTWRERKLPAILALATGLGGLFLFSWKIALPAAMVLAGWMLLDQPQRRSHPLWQTAQWIAILAGAAAVVVVTAWWLKWTVLYEADLTFAGSGMIQDIIRRAGKQYLIPFVTAYGFVQPLLPAALTEPGAWIWRAISTLRALGWYALLPVLIYPLLGLWKVKDAVERRLLLWTSLMAWGWIFISSLRAGGDISDNPRYRAIFLVWMALLAAWAWTWALEQKSAWLPRILAVEGVFLLCFLVFYLARYYHVFPTFSLEVLLAVTALGCGAIVVGGLAWDRARKRPARPAASAGGRER